MKCVGIIYESTMDKSESESMKNKKNVSEYEHNIKHWLNVLQLCFTGKEMTWRRSVRSKEQEVVKSVRESNYGCSLGINGDRSFGLLCSLSLAHSLASLQGGMWTWYLVNMSLYIYFIAGCGG